MRKKLLGGVLFFDVQQAATWNAAMEACPACFHLGGGVERAASYGSKTPPAQSSYERKKVPPDANQFGAQPRPAKKEVASDSGGRPAFG